MGSRASETAAPRGVIPGFGTKVRRRRTDLGLTPLDLETLCRRYGARIDRAKIAHLERGSIRGGLTLPTLRALCLALDLSADYLLGISSDPHPR